MSDVKVFKDPIYGYIEVENDLIKKVIDKPAFQRLRRIIQTSYSPLYASAVHNRFTHSLGVYFLGKIAINTIYNKRRALFSFYENINSIFMYACLLHDVGHAPFSHTGEKYYLNPLGDYTKLHEHLKRVVDSEDFARDIPAKAANPHEIMSAIVGIEQFPDLFSTAEDRSFFARAIVGYHYQTKTKNNDIKNCLIDLLNSKFIDVDKLDYLMRDTYMTGFESVNIDYIRLLSSLDIVVDENENVHLVFEKNAISVIENVVYARDLEKKWIQIHPSVLYDIYLLEKSIDFLNSKVNVINEAGITEKHIFSYESLIETGSELNNNIHIRLLCDDDLIYLLKNEYSNLYFNEYLDRNARRHPLWKSESEYKSFFISILNSEEQEKFNKALEQLAKFMKTSGYEEINDSLVCNIKKQIKESEELVETINTTPSDKLDPEIPDIQSVKALLNKDKEILNILEPLKIFSEENNLDFSFILLQNSLFYSAFGNDDFSKIKILFKKDDPKSIKYFSNIATFDGIKGTIKDFYYIFYRRPTTEIDFDIQDLVKKIRQRYL